MSITSGRLKRLVAVGFFRKGVHRFRRGQGDKGGVPSPHRLVKGGKNTTANSELALAA